MRELAADDASRDMKGWLQRSYAYLFQADIFASVSSNDTLMRIHATAEEYDKAAEELFSTIQVSARQPLSHKFHVIMYCYLLHTVMFCTYTAASANLRLAPK